MTLTIIVLYLVAVLVIGIFSHRFFRGTSEDYFVAARTLGPFVLLVSLFGANMTAFTILGSSGEAYMEGIGVFALMASSSGLVIPIVFYFVGTRVWALGKRRGYLTPVQFFRERWGSDNLGLLIFLVQITLLIPYLLIGVMGGGTTLTQVTGGQVPDWVGGLVICAVVLAYVTYGGMRGTVWVNVFQTVVLLTLGFIAFWVIVSKLGGLEAAMNRVAATHPDLLIRGEHIKPWKLLTYTCIPLSVGMFPHMFLHWLTARSAASFRPTLAFYPVCIAIVWVPAVVLGVVARGDFPDLGAAGANSILVKMIDLYAPGVLAGLLAAGVFAAIMNSFDSQVLAAGTMFTQDIVRHYGFHDRMSERQQILVGRLFMVGILIGTYLLSRVVDRSIFKLGVWCFTGFAALFPVVVAALFWKRSTKWGAAASTISVIVLWTWFVAIGWESQDYTIADSGVMPVAVMLVASALAMVVGSLLTKPPETAVLDKFFPAAPPQDAVGRQNQAA
ncbi:MAG TPA: sodium:solute symporter family protein [Thermoanaerobaculia bacterium]|nr:sodium:solute symporter family protein [Thermoanaerobaculia bacterium]